MAYAKPMRSARRYAKRTWQESVKQTALMETAARPVIQAWGVWTPEFGYTQTHSAGDANNYVRTYGGVLVHMLNGRWYQ